METVGAYVESISQDLTGDVGPRLMAEAQSRSPLALSNVGRA